ncbi:hypothetical protein SM007_23420, partial [Streptomyces avermitilis]
MISVVYGPERTRSAVAIRVLALVALVWILMGVPPETAVADACAYVSTGPDGIEVVAAAGDGLRCPVPSTP